MAAAASGLFTSTPAVSSTDGSNDKEDKKNEDHVDRRRQFDFDVMLSSEAGFQAHGNNV